MNYRLLAFAGLVLLGSLTAIRAAAPTVGPGLTLSYHSAIKDMDVNIENARLPDGTAFPHCGGLGGPRSANENVLADTSIMGAAPDGRRLPEYVDFEWREFALAPPEPTPQDPFSQAHKDWEAKLMAEYYSHPTKKQRVLIRTRVPVELVKKVVEANRHSVKGHGAEASIVIHFIWTDYGIKLRWQIWHTPAFNAEYYSDDGGDEVVPSGTTMVAAYSNIIQNHKLTVDPGSPKRFPGSASGPFFSGSPTFAYTDKPISGGESLVAFESEPELPEWVDFDWRLFPITIPRQPGEIDSAYDARTLLIYHALPVKNERIKVRGRIPPEVRDELTAATRSAQAHKASSSVIYLYFIWTDSGIKLHWRLKRSRPDGSFISVREGGDELAQAVRL